MDNRLNSLLEGALQIALRNFLDDNVGDFINGNVVNADELRVFLDECDMYLNQTEIVPDEDGDNVIVGQTTLFCGLFNPDRCVARSVYWSALMSCRHELSEWSQQYIELQDQKNDQYGLQFMIALWLACLQTKKELVKTIFAKERNRIVERYNL